MCLGWLKKTISLIKYNCLLQWRSGIYLIYVVISLIYTYGLFLLPESKNRFWLAYVIFTDPTLIGAMFIGVLMLNERCQKFDQALLVAPISGFQNFISKFISLFFITLISGVSITIFTVGLNIYWITFILSLLGASLLTTILIYLVIDKIDNLNQLIFWLTLFSLIINLPILAEFNYFPKFLAYCFPSYDIFILIAHSLKVQPNFMIGSSIYLLMIISLLTASLKIRLSKRQRL